MDSTSNPKERDNAEAKAWSEYATSHRKYRRLPIHEALAKAIANWRSSTDEDLNPEGT